MAMNSAISRRGLATVTNTHGATAGKPAATKTPSQPATATLVGPVTRSRTAAASTSRIPTAAKRSKAPPDWKKIHAQEERRKAEVRASWTSWCKEMQVVWESRKWRRKNCSHMKRSLCRFACFFLNFFCSIFLHLFPCIPYSIALSISLHSTLLASLSASSALSRHPQCSSLPSSLRVSTNCRILTQSSYLLFSAWPAPANAQHVLSAFT